MFRSMIWGLTTTALLLGAGVVGNVSEAQGRGQLYVCYKPVVNCCDCSVCCQPCVVEMTRRQARRAARRGEICCPVQVDPCCCTVCK